MALIKNIHHLEGIPDKDLKMMEHAALEHSRHSGITFKIKEYDGGKATIQITQEKNSPGIYHNQKRLIEIVHETFDRFFKKIQVHAIPFVESPTVVVNAAWILKQMLEKGVKLKDIASETGLDYPNLSTYMSGEKLIPQAMKALFYYYFASKKKLKDGPAGLLPFEDFKPLNAEEKAWNKKYNEASKIIAEKLATIPEKARLHVLRDLKCSDLSLMNLFMQSFKDKNYDIAVLANALLVERGFNMKAIYD